MCPRLFPALSALAAVAILAGCPAKPPKPGEPKYAEVVTAFTVGVIGLQTGAPGTLDDLRRATELAPMEPAVWYNLAVAQARADQMEDAGKSLNQAKKLIGESSQLEELAGRIESRSGHSDAAITRFRKAIELDPNNLPARYALKQELERKGGPEADAQVQKVLAEILDVAPENFAVRVELAQAAAKAGDAASLRAHLDALKKRAAGWAPRARELFGAAERSVAAGNARAAATDLAFLRNVLLPTEEWKASYDVLTGGASQIGVPMQTFLVLPPPPANPAPPDTALTFQQDPVAATPATANWTEARAVYLSQPEAPVPQGNAPMPPPPPVTPPTLVLAGSGRATTIGQSGVNLTLPAGTPAASDGILAVDFENDFKVDLAFAGSWGLRLFRQRSPAQFEDVTARTKLPAAVINKAANGVWAADIESDGDLDLVLGQKGAPAQVLRNNGDGTWLAQSTFAAVRDLRGFAWADLDDDGDVDSILLDGAGALHVFDNERSGSYRKIEGPQGVTGIRAVSVADVNGDRRFDLVTLGGDGAIRRHARKEDGSGWESADLARWDLTPKDGPTRLLWAELDNNGALDLVATGAGASQIWLMDENRALAPLAQPVAAGGLSVADFDTDGKLDVVGLADGKPARFLNRTAKGYQVQVLRPRAQPINDPTRDQRANSYAVGGSVEVRAGLLYQHQLIDSPVMHFGLGTYKQPDWIRTTWPHATTQFLRQGELDGINPTQPMVLLQRLGGSCPWLFAWNGQEMGFVTDCIWRSPLGLRINAQATADADQTRDWVKVRGDQLAPRDGFYDLRITADLWETHFFDHLSLMVVDHPADTDVWVDERMAFPQPPLEVIATTKLQPVAAAVDDKGRDAMDVLRERDRRSLKGFGFGRYQGVTRDHWVELTLPEEAPRSGQLYLICNGWIYPTDSSINVALGQGSHTPPSGLSIETPDAKGRWSVARPGLGFPAGKVKTVVLNISEIFKPGAPRKLRLRTNLEIYWDQIGWAAAKPNANLQIRQVPLDKADLRYRGFVVTTYTDGKSYDRTEPEMPIYSRIAQTGQRWRDLEGYYTRFGDVKPLLTTVDDRYVIMNAGDELGLLFPEQPAPAAGMLRDYVLVGDGWEKDGNLNTTFGQTVLPLPSHANKQYNTPPGRLEDDPVYQKHKADWETYHTRYVSPDSFRNALRPRPDRSPR